MTDIPVSPMMKDGLAPPTGRDMWGWFARGEGGQVEFWEPFAQPIHINQIGDQIKVAIVISPV
jgi:hypothetical protein